jgi:hypothetical protein
VLHDPLDCEHTHADQQPFIIADLPMILIAFSGAGVVAAVGYAIRLVLRGERRWLRKNAE